MIRLAIFIGVVIALMFIGITYADGVFSTECKMACWVPCESLKKDGSRFEMDGWCLVPPPPRHTVHGKGLKIK